MSSKLSVSINTKEGVVELAFAAPTEIAKISIPVLKRVVAALLIAEASEAEKAPGSDNGGPRIIHG